jgi:hypothetical protein
VKRPSAGQESRQFDDERLLIPVGRRAGIAGQQVQRPDDRVGWIELQALGNPAMGEFVERAGVPALERRVVRPTRQQMKDGAILMVHEHFHAEKSWGVVHHVRAVEKRLPDHRLHTVCHSECGDD